MWSIDVFFSYGTQGTQLTESIAVITRQAAALTIAK